VADLNIEVAKNATTAAAANGAGLTVTGAAATLTYTNIDDRWNFNKNLNVTTVYGALSGNASTATILATARTINTVSFNGSADIVVTAAAGTLTGATLASGVTASSLTSVGTISTGTWSSTVSTSSNSTMSGTLATGALTTTGAITATGEITAFFSDARLKKDVVAITDPIAKIMSIRGVTFRPNETALALGIADTAQVGVIAQEIEAMMPELVSPSAFPGFLTVKYDKLTALLIEAVKAQQGQIETLTAQIAALANKAGL